MAAGAEFWVTYHVTDSNGVSYTPYSEDFSSSLSDTPETAEFSETSVTFYNYRNEEIAYLSFDNPYNYNGVDYPISAIHCDGTDAQNNTFNVSGGCQIIIYYGKDPETGGSDVGGPDQGGNNPGEGSGDNDSSAEIPISFSFTVKSYKSGTLTEVADDFVVEKCYKVERYDEGTVGDWGLLNLKYYTNYDFTGKEYIYTEEQTHTLSSIKGYKLSGFFGLENGYSLIGEKEGINKYTFEAYYIVNDFEVKIDAKGIDRSYVTVQHPYTESKYKLPYTDYYPSTSLLLEALTSDNNYVFDYWEINGEKYSENNTLSYNINQDTEIYCHFKRKELFKTNQITTNSGIYNKTGYVYKLNDNKCPTKSEIISNDVSKIITIPDSYLSNQCVKYSDVNIGNKKITLIVNNNCGNTIKDFKIIVGYINNTKENQIFEKTALEIIGGDYITSGISGNITIEIDLSPNSDYNSIDLKTKQIYVRTELKFDLPHTVNVSVSNDARRTKKLLDTFTTTNKDYTFKNKSYNYDFLLNSDYPYIHVDVN